MQLRITRNGNVSHIVAQQLTKWCLNNGSHGVFNELKSINNWLIASILGS